MIYYYQEFVLYYQEFVLLIVFTINNYSVTQYLSQRNMF